MRHLYLLVLLLLGATPLTAQPYLYWTNANNRTIGRANLDGSNVNNSFVSGMTGISGLLITDSHIYWGNPAAKAIGRASIDGTGVNNTFISGTAAVVDLAIDGTYIYWVNHASAGTIGRANIDGSNVDNSFITTGSQPAGITLDGTYLYWAHWGINSKSIGRANLDGSNVNNSFITESAANLAGLTVDGSYVYWTSSQSNRIGRANLDGSNVNESFISGLSRPYDVIVDGPYIYWTSFATTGAIGRANLDGSGANNSFITTGGTQTWGVTTSHNAALPVELTNFTATFSGTSALLRWETASETNNAGFDIELRMAEATAFRSLGFVSGRGTTAEASHYAFTAEGLTPGTHVFRLRQVDFDGAAQYSPEVELTIEADGLALALGSISHGAIRGTVAVPSGQVARVKVFDALGRQVISQEVAQGAFAVEAPLASGVYIVRVEAGTQTITRSVVVAR